MSNQDIYSQFFNKGGNQQQPVVKQYNPKQNQQNKNFQSQSKFAAGPTLHVDGSDIVKSTEEGFTGPSEDWFDGKYFPHTKLIPFLTYRWGI